MHSILMQSQIVQFGMTFKYIYIKHFIFTCVCMYISMLVLRSGNYRKIRLFLKCVFTLDAVSSVRLYAATADATPRERRPQYPPERLDRS